MQIRSSFLQRRALRVCTGQLLDEADVALGHFPKYRGELQVQLGDEQSGGAPAVSLRRDHDLNVAAKQHEESHEAIE